MDCGPNSGEAYPMHLRAQGGALPLPQPHGCSLFCGDISRHTEPCPLLNPQVSCCAPGSALAEGASSMTPWTHPARSKSHGGSC